MRKLNFSVYRGDRWWAPTRVCCEKPFPVEDRVKRTLVLMTLLLIAISGMAQTPNVQTSPLTDQDIKLLRQDVQAAKEDVLRHTMLFSDAEDKAFWPVYTDYAKEQKTVADSRLALIKDYAQNYDNIDNGKARSMTQQLFDIEDQMQALRKKYFPKFEQAIGAKRAAKFYQVDNRLTMMLNIQLASEIPLVP